MNNNKKPGKKTCQKITVEHFAQIRVLYQISNVGGKELLDMFLQYGKAQVHMHAKKLISGEAGFDKCKLNKGRLKKLSVQDTKSIKHTLLKLRRTEGTLTSKCIQLQAGVTHVSNCTVIKNLNSSDYKYLQSHKKGLMIHKDTKLCLAYCKDIKKKKLGQDFWCNDIAFYLNGIGFEFKTNPLDQACAPQAREWQKPTEGLDINCVAKGKKEGCDNAKFMVRISHGKGVLFCKQYFGAITGLKFRSIMRSMFKAAFTTSGREDKCFLMGGSACQNAAVAHRFWDLMVCELVSILSRSPDLNLIGNFLNLVRMRLKQESIDKSITKENFKEFSERVQECIFGFCPKEIDPIIESVDKHVDLIIKQRGQRIKY